MSCILYIPFKTIIFLFFFNKAKEENEKEQKTKKED
jgi:hypothetical protein